MENSLPKVIENEVTLDEVLTQPSPALVEFIHALKSPLVILGAGGKMGPSLAVLARLAAEEAGHPLEVVAVSRFSDPTTRQWLEENEVRTINCDLMERDELDRLPDSANVIYLVGVKFGTSENPARTWAVNTLIPAYVSQRYSLSRTVVLSTGNVYPLVPVESIGSVETDPLAPVGEYAISCLARERIFEYYSQENGMPITIIRLNYALDLRYGVLVDLARNIIARQPIDVTMGYVNCIWQGDANECIIRALGLARTPPLPLNLTGPDVLSIRSLAQELGTLLEVPVQIVGQEAPTALLSNASQAAALFSAPHITIQTMLRWTAHWVKQGGRLLNKPTHFEVRNGGF